MGSLQLLICWLQNTGRSLDDGPDDTSTVNNPQQDISALETFPNQPFVSSQFTQPTIAMSPDADTLYSQISDYPTRTFDTPSYHPEDYIATPDALSPPSSSVPLTSVSPSWVDPQPPRSRTALNQVHPRFSDTFTNSKSNLLSPASRQRSDLSHLTSQSTAAPSPTSAPSDSASLQSSQAPVEERVQQVLTAVRGSGFPSLENMVLHYYSSDFSHDPILSEMQHRSRRRELGTFLTALTRDAETWSPREAERYEETVTGRAEHIVHREIHRFLEQDRMPGTQDMARLREEVGVCPLASSLLPFP